jgi:hypothetical protein
MATGFDEGVGHSRSGFLFAQRFDSWAMICGAERLRTYRAHKMQVSSTALWAATAPKIFDVRPQKADER